MRTFPVLTVGFIGLNMLVYKFCLMQGAYDTALFKFALLPGFHQSTAYITSMFMHQGWDHVFWNMVFLAFFGMAVEDELGPFAFTGFYIGTGIAASAFHYYFGVNPGQEPVPTIGASGAVMGVVGGYLVLLPTTTMGSFQKSRIWILILGIPITIMAFRTLFRDIASVIEPPVIGPGGSGGVAHWAHIGGFFSGAFAGLSLRPFLRTHKQMDHVALAKPVRKWALSQESSYSGGNQEEEPVNEPVEAAPEPAWVNWAAAARIVQEGTWPPKIQTLIRLEQRAGLLDLLGKMYLHKKTTGDQDMARRISALIRVLGAKPPAADQ